MAEDTKGIGFNSPLILSSFLWLQTRKDACSPVFHVWIDDAAMSLESRLQPATCWLFQGKNLNIMSKILTHEMQSVTAPKLAQQSMEPLLSWSTQVHALIREHPLVMRLLMCWYILEENAPALCPSYNPAVIPHLILFNAAPCFLLCTLLPSYSRYSMLSFPFPIPCFLISFYLLCYLSNPPSHTLYFLPCSIFVHYSKYLTCRVK